jgi:hypothetical protein
MYGCQCGQWRVVTCDTPPMAREQKVGDSDRARLLQTAEALEFFEEESRRVRRKSPLMRMKCTGTSTIHLATEQRVGHVSEFNVSAPLTSSSKTSFRASPGDSFSVLPEWGHFPSLGPDVIQPLSSEICLQLAPPKVYMQQQETANLQSSVLGRFALSATLTLLYLTFVSIPLRRIHPVSITDSSTNASLYPHPSRGLTAPGFRDAIV